MICSLIVCASVASLMVWCSSFFIFEMSKPVLSGLTYVLPEQCRCHCDLCLVD